MSKILRELFYIFFRGKNVLNQKSELQRALEKHKDHQVKKEIENEKSQNKTLLERVIEERARRLENVSTCDFPHSQVLLYLYYTVYCGGSKVFTYFNLKTILNFSPLKLHNRSVEILHSNFVLFNLILFYLSVRLII